MADEVCSICSLRTSNCVRATDGIMICRGCARRIALIARSGADEIWSRYGSPKPQSEPTEPKEANALESFRAGVAELIPAQDSDSHANLAQAYREMGLCVDAIREASIAVTNDGHSKALRMLLSPPLLKPGGLDLLRERVLGLRKLN